MPRLRTPGPVAPRGVGMLIAACVMMWRADAMAQTALPVIAGSLAATPESNLKKSPPYQKFERLGPTAQLGPPPNFQPPAVTGAGDTGFDSSNSRKAKGKQQPKAKSSTKRAIVPVASAPVAVSPYQRALSNSAKAAFASGQPGQPPVAFGPIYTVRKKRKAASEADPYAALGGRSGGLLFYPAIELIGGHDSNPTRGSGGAGAGIYTVAPELRVQSDWLRHELKADLRGSYNYYRPDSIPTLSRPYFNGKVDGRVDVTRNTRIDLGARMLVSTDNPGSPNLQAGLSKLPIYTTFGGTGGIAHRFNRLEIGVKADIARTVYRNSSLIDGTTASNEDRNYNQYGGTVRAGYELSPGFMPYVEAGADTRRHDLATDFSGYQRNSRGFTAKLGSTVELSRLLTGEVAVGYVKRSYEDPRLDPLKGLVGNAALVWSATTLTTVKFSAQSTVGESTVAGVSGVLYRDAGVQLDHSLRRWLIGSLKAGVGFDDYVGSPRSDKRYYLGAGLAYKLNRSVQIKGEVRRDWLRSNETANDYTANVFLLGLRLQY